jgi:hypothetical protein
MCGHSIRLAEKYVKKEKKMTFDWMNAAKGFVIRKALPFQSGGVEILPYEGSWRVVKDGLQVLHLEDGWLALDFFASFNDEYQAGMLFDTKEEALTCYMEKGDTPRRLER